MSLTRKVERKLAAVGLVKFFNKDPTLWCTLAQAMYSFLKPHYGGSVHQADLAKYLVELIQVNDGLIDYLAEEELNGDDWFVPFADLIVDRTWADIVQ